MKCAYYMYTVMYCASQTSDTSTGKGQSAALLFVVLIMWSTGLCLQQWLTMIEYGVM